ncbi:MAG: hypothetical protein FWG90_10280 [Oscillospiraceae bacterium]|nr:hypothetical protein [Oscillospiraceae bacterium]
MPRKKKVSWVSVFEVIVIVLLILMIGFMAACNLLIKSDGSATPFLGLTFYKTNAVNMVPLIPVNTVIVGKASEIESINEHSVILCKLGEHTTLTRVVQIDTDESGRLFYVVKFDTSPPSDTFRVYEENVIAKAVWQMTAFGKFLDFATSTLGIILAVVVPLFLIVLFQAVRIVNIRKLEAEASSLGDIDEIIVSRDSKKEESPVTFTAPKFIEDVTDKFTALSPSYYESETTDEFRMFRTKEKKPELSMNITPQGRAEYSAAPPKKNTAPAEPLFTYDRLPKKTSVPASSNAEAKLDELYLNKPTKIEATASKSKVDEFFDSFSPSKSTQSAPGEERIVFTPHLSNVIPDKILDIQAESYAPLQTSFDNHSQPFYEKSEKSEPEEKVQIPPPKPEAQPLPPKISTIPEMAVVPKETLAPPKKKKNNKTVEELMNLINSAESKLK